MAKKFTIPILFLLVIGLLYLFNPVIFAYQYTYQDAIEELQENDFQVTILGDERYESVSKYANLERVSLFSEIDFESTNSLWISGSHIDNVLTPGNKRTIVQMLKNGKTIFLLDKDHSQYFADYIDYDINLEEELLNDDEVSVIGTYVSYNYTGNYNFGVILTNDKVLDEDRLSRTMLVQAWLKRDNLDLRGDVSKEGYFSKRQTRIFGENEASATITGSPGTYWKLCFGPKEYVFATPHGELFEKKRGWWLNPTYDQTSYEDYTALNLYWESVPYEGTLQHATLRLIARSDISQLDSPYNSNHGLERYGPTTKPNTGSLSYSIGLSGTGLSFIASWTISDSDLSLTNTSRTSIGYMKLQFDYDESSNYAQHTSNHEPSFSYNIPNGSTVAYMNNYRFCRFGRQLGFTYSTSANYNTKLRRPTF